MEDLTKEKDDKPIFNKKTWQDRDRIDVAIDESPHRPANPDKVLSPMRKKFARKYVEDMTENAPYSAARAAGFKNPAQDGETLLDNPDIQLEIERQRESILREVEKQIGPNDDRYAVNQANVIREIARIAYSDHTDYYNFETEECILSSGKKLPRDQTAAIHTIIFKEIKMADGSIKMKPTKVQLYDKTKALDMLGRFLGIFEKDNKQRAYGATIEDVLRALPPEISKMVRAGLMRLTGEKILLSRDTRIN
jgi:phage terminase small subunit